MARIVLLVPQAQVDKMALLLSNLFQIKVDIVEDGYELHTPDNALDKLLTNLHKGETK